MNLTENPQLLVYLVAGAAALAVGGFTWYVIVFLRNHSREAAYEGQLQELIDDYGDEDELNRPDRGRNLIEKWKLHWQAVAQSSGVAAYKDKDNQAHFHVFLLGLAIVFIVSLLTLNPLIGVGAAVGVVYGLSAFLKMKFNRASSVIQDQLPGFLFALRANVQANETPQRAILKVVGTMPSPLREDLTIVEQKLMANSTFKEALQALIQKTQSRELRFLADCLIQASASGSTIEPQIEKIQHVLSERKKAADELSKAVRATLPAIYVSSFAIPLSFVAAYLLSPTAKDFWFQEPLSYAMLALVGVLYAGGMFMTRRMVENIRNL